MTEAKKEKPDQVYSLEFLDRLIEDYFSALLEHVKRFPERLKIGDLLKMIELRIKQTPSDADRQEFWDMIESVRRKQLSGQSTETEESSDNEDPGETR